MVDNHGLAVVLIRDIVRMALSDRMASDHA